MVNGSGDLEMIAWGVDASGGFTRLGSSTGEAVSQVAICDACNVDGSGPAVEFTASINDVGRLGTEAWSVSPVLELTNAYTNWPVSALSVTLSNHSGHFITAARDKNGNLAVEAWGFSN